MSNSRDGVQFCQGNSRILRINVSSCHLIDVKIFKLCTDKKYAVVSSGFTEKIIITVSIIRIVSRTVWSSSPALPTMRSILVFMPICFVSLKACAICSRVVFFLMAFLSFCLDVYMLCRVLESFATSNGLARCSVRQVMPTTYGCSSSSVCLTLSHEKSNISIALTSAPFCSKVEARYAMPSGGP